MLLPLCVGTVMALFVALALSADAIWHLRVSIEGARADAVVTGASSYTKRQRGGEATYHEVSYRFLDGDGIARLGRHGVAPDRLAGLREGQVLAVRYVPRHPELSRLEIDSFPRLSLMALLGVLFAGGIAAWCLWRFVHEVGLMRSRDQLSVAMIANQVAASVGLAGLLGLFLWVVVAEQLAQVLR